MKLNQTKHDRLRSKLELRNHELEQISDIALALLREENPVQNEDYNNKLQTCQLFIEKLEHKVKLESHLEKLILINCYMCLGKHHVNFSVLDPLLHYSKAQNYFLQAINASLAALQMANTNIILLDNATAFAKITVYLACYYDKKNSAVHFKKIGDIASRALDYAKKWQNITHSVDLSSLLAIAYYGLNDYPNAIKQFDYLIELNSEQQDYSNTMQLEFMLALLSASKYLNEQRQYKKAITYSFLLLQLSELVEVNCADNPITTITNHRIKFECLLTRAIAHIGLADLQASKVTYLSALVTHLSIYKRNQASEVYMRCYPLISMGEQLKGVVKGLDHIFIYLQQNNISLSIKNLEQVFKAFIYDVIPNLDLIPEQQASSEILNQLANDIDQYMGLISAWPGLKELKINVFQKAAKVNQLLNNLVKVKFYEAMVVEFKKRKAKLEIDISDWESSIQNANPAAPFKAANKTQANVKSKTSIKKTVEVKRPTPVKREIKQNYYQTVLLAAYRLYKKGDFSAAIDLYSQLYDKYKTKHKLIAMQCLSGIGDCYNAWAKQTEKITATIDAAQEYRQKALQAYQQAVQLIPFEIDDYQDTDYREMRRLAEFIYPFLDAHPANAQEAENDEQPVVIEPKNKTNQSKRPAVETAPKKYQENKQPANKTDNTEPLRLVDYLAPSLEKILHQPVTASTSTICITKTQTISTAAHQAQMTLQEAGFYTYLVGGAVRDQILGKQPKDYDLVTNAHPQEIMELFPEQSKIVGNRFTLVLVKIEGEIFEITTLRQDNSVKDAHSVWAKDSLNNPYGASLCQDAALRDFTMNSLFYTNNTVLDFMGGYQDLKDKLIRTISSAKQRFLDDPIIMLRALRFAAELDFGLHEDIQAELPAQALYLTTVNKNRLYSEVQKTFLQGFGAKVFLLACQYQILPALFPKTVELLKKDERQQKYLHTILTEIDRYYWQNKQVSAAIFFAVMLWHPLEIAIAKQGVANSMTSLLDAQLKIMYIPTAIVAKIKAIWLIYIGNYHSAKVNIELPLGEEDFFRARIFGDLLKLEVCHEMSNTNLTV